MATIKNLVSGQIEFLNSHHTIGRNAASVDTHVSVPEVSNLHATIAWNGSQWVLKDMSSNGTWLDGEQVNQLAPYTLESGQIINLANIEKADWQIIDLAPPTPLLIPVQFPEESIPLERYNLIPDDEQPLCVIYNDSIGGEWQYQDMHHAKGKAPASLILDHNQTVVIGKQVYRFFCPKNASHTRVQSNQSHLANDFDISFDVSLDEETVAATLSCGSRSVSLGAKAHNYLLLYLARERVNEKNAYRLENADCGWVDNQLLSKALGQDDTYINIQICRIRKLFTQLLPDIVDADKVIERRRGATRICFGTKNIRIKKGQSLE